MPSTSEIPDTIQRITVETIAVRGSPGPWQAMRFDFRMTIRGNGVAQQITYTDEKNGTIPPVEYTNVDFIASRGPGVGLGWVGDKPVFFAPWYPKLTNCGGG